MAVFITIDMGSSGIMRGGVRQQSFLLLRVLQTEYSPKASAAIAHTKAPSYHHEICPLGPGFHSIR